MTVSRTSTAPRVAACIGLSAFPSGSHASVWFEHIYPSHTSDDEFVAPFRERFVSTGVDLISLQEHWQNARQRGTDTVSAYYTYLFKLQNQINALEGPIDTVQLFSRLLYGLQLALLDKIGPYVMIWDASKRTPNILKALAESFATKSKSNAPASNAINRGNKSFNTQNRTRCWYCKSTDHTADSCPGIAAKKAISVIIQSPWARKPLDRMCVHAGDGQTYRSGLDSMS